MSKVKTCFKTVLGLLHHKNEELVPKRAEKLKAGEVLLQQNN
jgi:hypothetical protein